MGTETGTFRKEGDYWTIIHNGGEFRLRDAVGLRYIRLLLERPGVKVSAAELLAAAYERGEEPDRRSSGRSAELRAERVRQSVQKAIKAAIERIAVNDLLLGYHLARTLRTGVFCCYRPDRLKRISWET